MTLSHFGLAALDYAAQGLAVFPLAPRSKIPLTTDGFKSATTDPSIITAWWTAHPRANIGGVPASAGLVALDIDTPSCWSLAMTLGLLSEPTHRVTTGLSQPGAETCHLYFKHPAPARDTRLGNTIIVRGANGYVVLPPSIHPVTGQAYLSDTSLRDAVPLPDRAALELMVQQSNAAASERASVALNTDAVTPGDRHATLVSVAGKLAAHGLLGTEGAALLHAYNTAHCSPPKPRPEVDSIWEYTTRREGAKRADEAALNATVDLSNLTTPHPTQRTILRVSELMQQPPDVPFLVDQLLPADGLAVLWAPASTGKTFVTLDIALHVALGRPWMGRTTKQADVLWVVGEGFAGMRSRVAAWLAFHDTDAGELEPHFLVRRVAWDITDAAHRYEVLTELKELAVTPSLVVIDTLSANGPAGFDDSDTADMKRMMDAARSVRDTYPATVLFTHHTGHDVSRMRGSTDFRGAVDASLKLTPAGGDGAVLLSIDKARDFATPEPIALKLTPAHGAQIVTGADAVDLSVLLASASKGVLDVLHALRDAGRALRVGELGEASGAGKYVHKLLRDCETQQYVVLHVSHNVKSWTLSEAGRRIVEANTPTPVLTLSPAPGTAQTDAKNTA
jgi:hypothetical protein